MSLGITAIWRVRPQHRLGLLIPREPLLFNCPPTCRRFSPSPVLTTVISARYSSKAAQDPSPSGDQAQAKADNDVGRDPADKVPTPSPITKTEVKGAIDEPILRPTIHRRGVRAPRNEAQRLDESLQRSKFVRSVLVEPAKIYPDKREARESWRAHHKSVSAQVYFQRTRRNSIESRIATSAHTTDWRRVLGLLAKNTPRQPKGWIEDGIKIELPESVYARIMDEGGDFKVGAIRRRTGVSIKASRGENPGDRPSLLLSGSRQAINMATEELRSISQSITITRLSHLAPGEERKESFDKKEFVVPPLTREEGGPFRRYKVDYNISTVPWPDTMSHQAFEGYVASLTDSVILPHLDTKLHNPTKYAVLLDHERAVARQLRHAFTRRDGQPWASCSALKLALSFLCEKGDKYLPEARSIFMSMDQKGLRMDVDVFNILLRAPTKTRHLQKFQQTLLIMTRRGLAPNLDTWMLFLCMVESVEVRSYILQSMHMKNLLGTPIAIQRVAEDMARFDADHAIQQGKDLNTFIQEQDERYGPDWLTRDAGNQVLDVLCRYKLYKEAFQLLDRMHARAESIPAQFTADVIAARPDVVSFNTIISAAKRHAKFNVMGNTIRKMKTVAFATQPDRITLHLLFESAWHLRMPTTVSIIWRYAALARLTTYRMRHRVAALLAFQPGMADSPTENGMTPLAYEHLKGKTLARDLAGGKAALDKIRSIAAGCNRAELAVLAAKVWPEAFENCGPAISFASVLSQAASRDWAFLRAYKEGRSKLRALWRRSKPKILPLKARRPIEAGWVDLAPLDRVDAHLIRPEDHWEVVCGDMKDFDAPRVDSRKTEDGLEIDDSSADEINHVNVEKVVADGRGSEEGVIIRKAFFGSEMAILDPDLWAESDTWRCSQPLSMLQKMTEEKILAVLEEMEKDYPKIPEDVPAVQEWEGPQLTDDEVGDVEGAVEDRAEADQRASEPIEGARDVLTLVQDEATEDLTGLETQKMTDDKQEAEDLPVATNTDIAKRIHDER
ncbi:hypothetical protein VM1G_10024 [Cytospora mali]|uniref:Pentatricopeptide repeat domain-containing protein n=1 Tax=Cytospora mali TaxID=578113 RepID=A0A194WDJ0_CYTMA|nr:hypothetical protein VM1G_10024 [Valsa mali]